MIRRDIRLIPTAALTATTIALIAFVTLHPHAALWAVVVALVLAVAGLFTLAAESVGLRAQLDDADRRAEDLEDQLTHADDIIRVLSADLVEAQRATSAPVPLVKPDLHIVPPQRDGSHDALPMADESWLPESPLVRGDDGRWS